MSEYTILAEWLDQNAHRKFPLDDSATGIDSTGSFQLPSSFLVDIFLAVPVGSDPDRFYVSTLLVRSLYVDVTISYLKPDNSSIVIGSFNSIPTNSARNSSFQISTTQHGSSPDSAFNVTTGTLVIGSCEEIIKTPGYFTLTYTAGRLVSTRISQGVAVFQSLTAGGRTFSGNVILKEGSNVKITPSYDAGTDTTTLLISADVGQLDQLAIPLVDDASVLANLTAIYGAPVTTINNIKPDAAYNFTMLGLDCTEVGPLVSGASITNPCGKPCCDKTTLEQAYEAIGELNRRYARIEGYYTTLSRNINELQSRMVVLEL